MTVFKEFWRISTNFYELQEFLKKLRIFMSSMYYYQFWQIVEDLEERRQPLRNFNKFQQIMKFVEGFYRIHKFDKFIWIVPNLPDSCNEFLKNFEGFWRALKNFGGFQMILDSFNNFEALWIITTNFEELQQNSKC